MSRIYLDYAATTPLNAKVFEAMKPYFLEEWGNPSGIYREGQKSREAIDDARHHISKILECSLEEIVFVSSATEANNLAIKGVLEAWRKKHHRTPHFITTPIEHSCIKNTAEYCASEGLAKVSTISVDRFGFVDPNDLKKNITKDTALVSIHYVNNEIGTVEPIPRLGKICEKQGIPFHVDAVQAAGILPLSVERLHCHLLSLSAHKFYGPKGVGLLYVRRGTEIVSQMHGGGQERKYRSGTENVASIVGMAMSLQIAEEMREKEYDRLQKLQIFGYELMKREMPKVKLNGPEIGEKRSPANLHFSFGELDGESLLIRLDLNGVAASLGSACTSGMIDPSHVLTAIGLSHEDARSGLRLTMGRGTTKKDLEKAILLIAQIVKTLRKEQEFA
ncbi:cysteine desulfurase [Candidatus Peregrinibacteria bacterium]|nr:cysteine desulfurase [Candidatus Peregrinibacteria bacterium]